ncbi:hypothetical protein DSECCO2_92950 [anaerobic digester metagenome]
MVRTVPFLQVREIIFNPEDAQEPWFYRRTYNTKDLEGKTKGVDVYHPGRQYTDDKNIHTIRGKEIIWDAQIHHVRVNCLTEMQWGVPEVFAAIDWSNAYKTFMEDWS